MRPGLRLGLDFQNHTQADGTTAFAHSHFF
jgi:hypothetical protein